MDNMNCTEFEHVLQCAVEERSEEQLRELRDHAASCKHCRAVWQEFAVLRQAIPLWKARMPDVDLVDAVMARTHELRPLASRSTSIGWWVSAAVATAAACVLALAVWPSAPDNAPQPDLQLADTDEPDPLTAPLADEQPTQGEVGSLVRDATDPYLELAEGVTDAVRGTRKFLPATEALADNEAQQEDRPSPASWINDWSQDLEPIGRDVANAMNFLLDAVPADPAPTI
jgi:hypothetical protein